MESIGDKLRNRRQEEGYSLDQVTRDTNIAKSYLEALEGEDFAVFPGEPYLIGFLRNYSEYLGLDANEMISLYKNFKIQEQPLPMDELIIKRGPSPLIFILLGILLVGAIVAGGFLLYPGISASIRARAEARAGERTVEEAPQEEEASIRPEGELFLFSDEITEQRFSVGTRIQLSGRDDSYIFTIVEAEDGVTLAAESGLVSFSLGEEREIDINGDGRSDLKVLVRDIDTSAGTVVLRLDKSLYGPEIIQPENLEPAIGAPQIASRSLQPRVLYSADSPEVITLVASFRGNCLFRYAVDNDPRQERFFQKDEVLRLNFSNSLRIWASNGGTVQGRIKGEEVPFGRSGQVVAWLLRWRITDGRYELVLFPVY
jgi:cytoskeleton protein RodZ